jgi:hypothetical protein
MVLLLNDVRAYRKEQEVDEQYFICVLKLMSMRPGHCPRVVTRVAMLRNPSKMGISHTKHKK